MHLELMDILVCPACNGDKPLRLDAAERDGDDVLTGTLTCESCGASHPITNGIPRFVPPSDDYCGNFGYQWQRWKALQIDRLSGHNLSQARFFTDSGWTPEGMAGKLVLDAGCGAGRFTDVAAGAGARVVAVDLSAAIDACRETTAVHGPRVMCVQASLYALPFRRGSFDALYCMGVIQHTPDPASVMAALPAQLKPGGQLCYNFYEEGLWRRLQIIKYALRLITPHLPIGATLGLSKFLVALLFWLTSALSGIPKVRLLNHFIPIAAVHAPELTRAQQYEWTLLDTFDWYGARFETRQHHENVAEILRSAGLTDVTSRPGLAHGNKPK